MSRKVVMHHRKTLVVATVLASLRQGVCDLIYSPLKSIQFYQQLNIIPRQQERLLK